MDDSRHGEGMERRDRQEGQGDGEVLPKWPQRPERAQPPAVRPRLDPPIERGKPAVTQGQGQGPVSGREGGDAGGGTAARGDDPKETRVLPVVETSRFDRGVKARGGGPPPVPTRPAQPGEGSRQGGGYAGETEVG